MDGVTGMDAQQQTMVTAVFTALGGGLGAIVTWWSRRRQEARADATAAISERDALLTTITETLIAPMQRELAELREWKAKAQNQLDAADDRNDRLVAFIYKLIGIIHRAGLDTEIVPADVPPGIHL